jgi:plastocyanin
MKKLVFLFLFSYALHVRADVIVVNVSNFQFTPNNFTVNMGDVIRFTLVSGVHTTTSTSVPTGASSWDQALNTVGQTFDYTANVPGNYSLVCTIHPFMTASFTVNAVVPVKLSAFSASTEKGKVVLNWQTLTEENADYFSVQRSENGKDFHEIGKVKAVGNSVNAVNYNYVDATINAEARYYYYQLLTVDENKKEERSKIILTRQENIRGKIIVSLSPNPVQVGDHLQIWFNADETSSLHASIFNTNGALVYKVEMSAFTGVNFGHLHIHDLPAGVYVLKLSIGKLKESAKFTVQ